MMNIMNPPADWSTLKKLIWLRGTPITGGEELTVSGTPPLSLPNSLGKPLKAWEVDVLPKQDLHGYDSPWPAGGGANKWDEEWELGRIDTTTGNNTPSYTQIRAKNLIPVIASEQYYVVSRTNSAGGGTDDGLWFLFYDADGNVLTSDLPTGFSSAVNAREFGIREYSTIAIPSNCKYIRFYAQSAYGTEYTHDIAINYPSIATTYSPYSNICPIYGTDKLTITTAGKNLFDQSQIGEASGITQNAEGYYTGLRSAWNLSFGAGFPRQPIFKPNTQYTISVLGYNDSSTSSTQIGFKYTDGTASYLSINSTAPDTYTLTTRAGKTVSFILGTFGSDGAVTFFIKDIMLVEGTSAEPYEPYNPSQTVLTLPQTVYTGTIGSEGGESRSAMVDLGDLTYTFHSNTTNRQAWTVNGFIPLIAPPLSTNDPVNAISSQLKSLSYNIPWTANSIAPQTYFNGQCIGLIVIFSPNQYADADEVKSALTGVQLCYLVNNAVQLPITTPTIPTPTGTATTWATAEDGTVDSMEVTYVGKA